MTLNRSKHVWKKYIFESDCAIGNYGTDGMLFAMCIRFNSTHRHDIIPYRSRLWTRGIEQLTKANMSSFSVEMAQIAYIFQQVTDNSLVIIDELGRGLIHFIKVAPGQMDCLQLL